MLDTRRHMELFDPESFNTPIHVIGAGATGSWLVLQLAKLGIKGELINVWDFDTVESHNVPNQAYLHVQVGKPKVEALEHVVQGMAGTLGAKYHNRKYERQRLAGYVFLMVDSMAERKRIWEQAVKMKQSVKLLIEPRMGLDVGRVYNVEPTNLTHIREYENTFYSDEEAEVSACGTSQTVITTALNIASSCARQLINHVNDIELDNEILYDFVYNNLITAKW